MGSAHSGGSTHGSLSSSSATAETLHVNRSRSFLATAAPTASRAADGVVHAPPAQAKQLTHDERVKKLLGYKPPPTPQTPARSMQATVRAKTLHVPSADEFAKPQYS